MFLFRQNYKFSLHTEPDLGIHIDLIEPEQYEPPETGAALLPEDEELLFDRDTRKYASTRRPHGARPEFSLHSIPRALSRFLERCLGFRVQG